MENKDFTFSFVVNKTPEEVFDAINKVNIWWSDNFKGSSQKLDDEFEVHFGDVHYSKHKLVEVVPGKKIVWLITDSRLNFLKNKSEWTGTKNSFEISEKDGKTQLLFTHIGLVPAIECFGDCSMGWTQYLQHSLLPFITTGKANLDVLNNEIEQKSIN